jgi:dUTPase
MLRVKIRRLPFYATPGDAGMDLLYAGYEEVVIKPFERKLLPTGIDIELCSVVSSKGRESAMGRGKVSRLLFLHLQP